MRRVPYDLLVTLFLLAAGAGLALLPVTAPEIAMRITSAVTAAGFVIAAILVLAGLRRRQRRPAGFLPLLAGLLLLATMATLTPHPRMTALASEWITVRPLSHQDFLEVGRAVGALAVALGFTVWVRTLVHRTVHAEMRRRTIERELQHLSDRVKEQEANLRELDILDGVTGALNRRAFLAGVSRATRRAAQLDEPFAFVLLRALDYEYVEKTKGDDVAHRILREIAQALRNATRGTDVVARLGGGEFAVVLGECPEPVPVLDRVVFALEGGPGATKKNPVHVHIGVVTVPEPAEKPDCAELLAEAEALLDRLPREGEQRIARETFRRVKLVGASAS